MRLAVSLQHRHRLLLAFFAAILGWLACGFAYQSIGQALDSRAAPAPGRLVQLEGHTMHLYCTGRGTPTILLEAGATGFAQTWAWVQPAVAQITRVCSYDRAGMGWSEDGGGAGHDGVAIARTLHALLHAADEPGPYVLGGHSFGAVFMEIFAALYPKEVAGMALVDPSHPDQLDRVPAEVRRQLLDFYDTIRKAGPLAPIGVLRATNLLGRSAEGLPPRDYRTARMFASSLRHLRTSYAELSAWNETMSAARRIHSFGNLPLLVISAGAPDPNPGAVSAKLQMHSELAKLSANGRQVIVPGADHFSLLMKERDAEKLAAMLRDFVATIPRDASKEVAGG
jgi:pimeloyl-ACP methyl ester carboxylesterase